MTTDDLLLAELKMLGLTEGQIEETMEQDRHRVVGWLEATVNEPRLQRPAGFFLSRLRSGEAPPTPLRDLRAKPRTSTFSPEMCSALRELGVADHEEPGPLTYGWALERVKGLRPKLVAESELDDA